MTGHMFQLALLRELCTRETRNPRIVLILQSSQTVEINPHYNSLIWDPCGICIIKGVALDQPNVVCTSSHFNTCLSCAIFRLLAAIISSNWLEWLDAGLAAPSLYRKKHKKTVERPIKHKQQAQSNKALRFFNRISNALAIILLKEKAVRASDLNFLRIRFRLLEQWLVSMATIR